MTVAQEPFCTVRDNWQRINLAIRQALEAISLAEMTEPLNRLVTIGRQPLEQPVEPS